MKRPQRTAGFLQPMESVFFLRTSGVCRSSTGLTFVNRYVFQGNSKAFDSVSSSFLTVPSDARVESITLFPFFNL